MTISDPRAITEMFIVGVVVVCVVFNLIMRLWFGSQATISVVLQDDSRQFPIIAGAAFGVLCHIFWPVR